MTIKIALAGNPNSGKTTLFNALTGAAARVGNWPGVTVEKKEGKLKGHKDVIIQDLPGIYSLSPYTLEEVVARNYLVDERPDVVINIIDGTNLERNLYLTTQLTEMGIPVLAAVNMIDIVEKSGDRIDMDALAAALGCPVAGISALKGAGLAELTRKALGLAGGSKAIPQHSFSGSVEHAIAHIEEAVLHDLPEERQRWYAIKLFERDERIISKLGVSEEAWPHIERDIASCELELDDDSASIIISERYAYISGIINKCLEKKDAAGITASDRIDRVVTNRLLGLPIFAAVMFLVYYISISTVGTMGTDWVNETLFGEAVPGAVGAFLESAGTAEWLSGLILDGIVAGVGAVLGFLPQMMVLFLCLAVLEDCGYMARIAFIMDRVFRRFGLSGKSFIPMLISTGCGVPGIMASRTIENDSDRRMTAMTTTFVPCGAKLPIIALIAGALFNDAAWVATSTYFVGVGAIVASGIILKKTRMFAGDPSPFVMELPAYHAPGVRGVLRSTLDRSWSFVKKATTIVLLSTVLIWFLSTFSWSMRMVGAGESMLASAGNIIAPLFAPLGWGDWRAAVATITGLIAKENVVGTFGILYGYAEVAEDGAEYWSSFQASFTQLAAYSFLIFNLLCAPCFAAIGALHREMMSGKRTLFAVGYQCAFAYAAALMAYQFGTFFTGGGFNAGVAFAFAVLAAMLYLLFRKPVNTNQAGLSSISAKAGAEVRG